MFDKLSQMIVESTLSVGVPVMHMTKNGISLGARYDSDEGGSIQILGKNALMTGWYPMVATCTYQGADDPTYSMYVSGNANLFLSLGMKFKCTQTTVKCFFVTAIGSYDSGNDRTLVSMYGGTDYDLANATITEAYFSVQKAPLGFPTSPTKWSVTFATTTQVAQASPSANTVYNSGDSITIPIGVWDITFEGLVGGNMNGQNCRLGCALSTSTNSVSDQIFRYFYGSGDTTATFPSFVRKGLVTLTSKTTYYVVMWTTRNSYSNIFVNSGDGYTSIVAVCSYL